MNRTKQNRANYQKYASNKAPKRIYTGNMFHVTSVIPPDPKSLPLPPLEWFQISEQS